MSVTAKQVLKTAGTITIETLETLVSLLKPWNAHRYCVAVGVPPFTPPAEWSPAVQELRTKLEAAGNPAQYAEVARQAVQVIDGITEFVRSLALERGQVEPTEVIGRRLILPILLEITRRHHLGLYTFFALIMFIDQRLQESYPQGLLLERWLQILADIVGKAGWGGSNGDGDVDVDWAPLTSDAIFVSAVISDFIMPRWWKQGFARWWYGFDHPPIPGFELQRGLAQHAFTAMIDLPAGIVEPAQYDQLDAQSASVPPEPFGLTLVPVPKSLDPSGISRLWIQIHGLLNIDKPLGSDWHFRMVNGAHFGVLASSEGLSAAVSPNFSAELFRKWDLNAPRIPEDDEDANLTFRASRFGVGARISADDVAAWIRFEGGELAISGGHWLDDYIPKLRLTFDLTGELSILNGASLKGGAGGDVLIPINTRIPLFIGAVTVRSIRVQTRFGLSGEDTVFRIEATANLTAELFTIIKVHMDGLGAAFQAGSSSNQNGNLAGIADAGWDAVLPDGAGIEVKFWRVRGGGALLYDSDNDRLAGALELSIGDAFSLKGLALYQRPATGGVRSWLFVLSLQSAKSTIAGPIQGGGILYGSNRATDPEAFLGAITTGDLDALLFAEDPVGNAPKYLAILERLFPTRRDASVFGIMARFSALGGRLTFDVGVLFEFHSSNLVRVYVVGQFVALLSKVKEGQRPDPLKEPVRILADGVALWDYTRGELDLRIMLRNSRVWGGELTGGATLFHGSPQADGQDHGTYVSIGGFHPDYVPPGPRISVPPRLQLNLSKGDGLKITVRGYLAVTPGSFQIGLGGTLEARFHGFGIRADINIDILFTFDGDFKFHLDLTVELLLGSRSLLSVHFDGTLTGSKPSVISGKVKVKFLFWTLSKSGSRKLFDGDAERETADVAGALAAAIADRANWEMGQVPSLTLSDTRREGVWLPIGGTLRVAQGVVPLNTSVERFGAVRLPGPQTFRLEFLNSGSNNLSTRPVSNEFALGMFLNLNKEEMLSSHGFETRDAGLEWLLPLQSGPGVDTTLESEDILIDPLSPPPAGEIIPISAVVLTVIKVFEIAPKARPKPIRVTRERFALVDEALEKQASNQPLFDARRRVRPGWKVVPETETV